MFRPLGRIPRTPTWRNAKFIFKMTFQATKKSLATRDFLVSCRGAENRTRTTRPPALRTATILHPAFAKALAGKPALGYFFFGLAIVLIHLAQAFTLVFSELKSTHWRLGYFLFLAAGLYLPRSLFRGVIRIEPLPQIEQFLFILGIVICF